MILQGQHGVVRKFPRLGLDCVTPMRPQFIFGCWSWSTWELGTDKYPRFTEAPAATEPARLAGRWTAASSLEPALAA